MKARSWLPSFGSAARPNDLSVARGLAADPHLHVHNFVGAWGYPHDGGQEDGPTLDRLMVEQWTACLEAAAKYGIYQKIIPYQFAAGNERDDDHQIAKKIRLPEGQTIDDYGFGLVRRDGKTPRPVYDWLKQHGEGYSTRINGILRAVMDRTR